MSLFNAVKKAPAANPAERKPADPKVIKNLQAQSATIMQEIDAVCKTIGEKFYLAFVEGTQAEGLDELCAEITQKKNSVDSITEEIDRLNYVKRCPECGFVMDITSRFCPQCGQKMPEPPAPETCPECGTVREGSDRFCSKCGHAFDAAEDAPKAE